MLRETTTAVAPVARAIPKRDRPVGLTPRNVLALAVVMLAALWWIGRAEAVAHRASPGPASIIGNAMLNVPASADLTRMKLNDIERIADTEMTHPLGLGYGDFLFDVVAQAPPPAPPTQIFEPGTQAILGRGLAGLA